MAAIAGIATFSPALAAGQTVRGGFIARLDGVKRVTPGVERIAVRVERRWGRLVVQVEP